MARVKFVLAESFLSEDEHQRKKNIEARLKTIKCLKKSLEKSEESCVNSDAPHREEG